MGRNSKEFPVAGTDPKKGLTNLNSFLQNPTAEPVTAQVKSHLLQDQESHDQSFLLVNYYFVKIIPNPFYCEQSHIIQAAYRYW